MKTIVVVDADGFIRATAPTTVKLEGKDAPRGARLVPGEGQVAHKLDVPAAIANLDPVELHRGYRVSLRGKPRLVKLERKAAPAAETAEASPPAPARKSARKKKR